MYANNVAIYIKIFFDAGVFNNYQFDKRSYSFQFASLSHYQFLTTMKVLLFAASLIVYVNGFCFHQYGGIGEYHRDCPDSGGKR